MRKLTDHIVDGDSANHQLTITVTDEPGSGGANHAYAVDTDPYVAKHGRPRTELNQYAGATYGPGSCLVSFQNGPIKEFGVNGVTHEALLTIVIDRLRSFQAGPYACEDNHTALCDCIHALNTLQNRTRARIARGVEGTHQK